ncbi:ras and Rab interactor 3 isoform X2 [Ahaetulla prasina]|uniref:ras and Rab interactor 3 isoform X2 n=1 Tax=Ahaetulla prasina TaxID=499056 RepID=UPI002649E0B0|nr:ras and Rab interactor 3 isoform X2 [Ahaetulla prasina]
MMKMSMGNQGSGPATETGEEEEDKGSSSQPIALRNCFHLQRNSILEKLIKTCPVWLQFGISLEKASDLLCKEPSGIFMVRKDETLKNLFLLVHFPVQKEGCDILEYKIKEEKSLLHLEGSLLVFEDIFKLVAFYCVSRDLLPYTLRLPQAILEANSATELETISDLGTGFWNSSLHQIQGRRLLHSVKDPAYITAQAKKGKNPSQPFASGTNNCSCETELSIGSDKLWFVNPIFIEESSYQFPPHISPSEIFRESPSGVSNFVTKPPKRSPTRRPPPPPPPSLPPPSLPSPSLPPPSLPPPPPLPPPLLLPFHAVKQAKISSMTPSKEDQFHNLEKIKKEMKTEINKDKEDSRQELFLPHSLPSTNSKKIPPSIPPRRCSSERTSGNSSFDKSQKCSPIEEKQVEEQNRRNETLTNDHQGDKAPDVLVEVTEKSASNAQNVTLDGDDKKELAKQKQNLSSGKPSQPPIPPLRKKRFFKQSSSTISFSLEHKNIEESEVQQENKQRVEKTCSISKKESKSCLKLVSISDCERSSDSLHSPIGNARAQMSASEPDSYSTSSTEDEFELRTSPTVKKTHSMILGRAKRRLSMVSLSNVFTAFLSSDRKLQKKIVELAQDKDSYFGNLVQDYKVYSLEMMAKQISSTEMLQEIRLMMTQLKSYLIQSTELKSLMDQTVHTDEKLEVIIESALHKCVLKPLKVPIDTYLREIHNKDGSFKLLKENQQVIQNTTTTELGVTTSVPESALLERIFHKFTTMTKAYSPEKKISILLKSCKLIYDSMTQGNPGSYYLITTYGAVELIKSYDKIAVTRQLSTEVQDSIHRWERRRTLNKARASRSSVQDFIAISFMEAEAKTRTLAYRTDSTTHQLIQQCAEKFEVSEPQDYGLFVQVDNKTMQMDDDALPHQIKSHLLNKEPMLTFCFIYKQLGGEESPVPIIKDTDAL